MLARWAICCRWQRTCASDAALVLPASCVMLPSCSHCVECSGLEPAHMSFSPCRLKLKAKQPGMPWPSSFRLLIWLPACKHDSIPPESMMALHRGGWPEATLNGSAGPPMAAAACHYLAPTAGSCPESARCCSFLTLLMSFSLEALRPTAANVDKGARVKKKVLSPAHGAAHRSRL